MAKDVIPAEARAELPANVLAEIDGAKDKEVDEDLPPPPPEEPVKVSLSRRERERQANEERIAAAERRAQELESKLNEAQRARDAEAQAWREIALRQQQPQQYQRQEEPREERPVGEQVARRMKQATEALGKGDIDEYHRRLSQANELQMQAMLAKLPKPSAQPQQQFQPKQKPAWMLAIEMENVDVLTAPRGEMMTIAAHDHFLGHQNVTPESLREAYALVRKQLNLPGKKNGSNGTSNNSQARQLYSGAGSSSVGGGKRESGSVKLTPSQLAVARRVGMSPQDYARAYAQSNPDEVSDD